MVSDGSCEEGLACAWWAVHQHSFGLGDAQRLEYLRVFDGEFNDFFDFFHLLVEPSDHVVGGVWYFLDLHEGDEWVHFGGEHFMQ